jgi:branched-chain amino acid transport system substrate-binding protein
MTFLRRTRFALAVLPLTVAPALADVTLAMNGPLTGSYAIFGDQMKRGAEYMVKTINDKGGLLGQKINFIIGDDACDPKQAVNVANKAATAGAKVVIGHYCSGSSIPASDVYHENNIIEISPASTNPKYTDDAFAKKWNNVFRTCGRDDYQGVTAGTWVASNFKGKKVAILHDKSPYGKGLADATRAQINKLGLQEILYEGYNPGEKDYNAIISRLKQTGVDMVYIGGYHTEVGLMLRQARDAGLQAQFMSGDANSSEELAAIAGPAADGFLFTFGPDARKMPSAKNLVEAFRAQGFDPEGYTLYTVAAVEVWSQAVQKANSFDAGKVSAAIKGNTFETVLGNISFDEKGDVKDPKYMLYIYKGGKYSEMQM